MEFRYRAGEERDSSSSSSNGYFAEQALRAGFGIGSSGFVPPAKSSTEALLEELRREGIREELLVREIAHKRMLEEEIRRELEIERLLAMRRLEEERFLPMEMEGRFGFGRLGAGFLLEDEGTPFLGMPPRFRGGIRMDERPTPPRVGDVGDLDRPPVPRKSIVGKTELSKLLSKSGISGSKDDKPSVHQVSGVKRKAASELPQLAKKEWSCSLCQVTASSQSTLDKHLQGKKHKLKAAQLTKNKATSKKLNASSLMGKEGDIPFDQAKMGISASEPATKIGAEAKMKQCKTLKAVWCNLCKVKCNTPAVLDCHLKGKKHKAQLSKKGDGIGTASPSTEVVKEVTEQKEQEVEVKAEDDVEATYQNGEEVKAEDDAKATDKIGRVEEVKTKDDATITDENGNREVMAEDMPKQPMRTIMLRKW